MDKSYKHLSLEERARIAHLHHSATSVRQIASIMGREPSTISRELRRNRFKTIGYEPVRAMQLAASRRWRGSRLARKPSLQKIVLERLAMGQSPEQIAGRLALENNGHKISHESIYRYIYAEIKRTNDTTLRHYLPRGKFKRGFRGRKGRSVTKLNPNRKSVHDRPIEAENRLNFGHWEGDLMLFSTPKQAVLTLHERKSRFTIVHPLENKTADGVARHMVEILADLPQDLRKTITLDNGNEFARHADFPLKAFFCDAHKPWQKGGVENANGRFRRYLPRKADIKNFSNEDFIAINHNYNNTPRKCLDFLTPAELFAKQLLHFKCESTHRFSTG